MWQELQNGNSIEIDGKIIESSQVTGEKRPGKKIGISGDTRPTEKLEKFFQDSDYLSFDCTFSFDLQDRAIETNHSTAREAAELAKKAGAKRVVLLDVRRKIERVISIIPGAIKLENFNKNISKYKNKKIVAYCTIGARSSRVVEKLIKRGHNAFNLKGSLLGWINYGGKLVKENGVQTKDVYLLGGRHLIPPDHTPRP